MHTCSIFHLSYFMRSEKLRAFREKSSTAREDVESAVGNVSRRVIGFGKVAVESWSFCRSFAELGA